MVFRDLRFIAGLLLGLVLGVVLGVLVLHQEPAPGALDANPSAALPESSCGADETTEVVSPPVLTGSATAGSVEPEPPTDTKALETTLRAAHVDGDWLAFVAALERLGAADTPEADRILVAILADTSISFREPMADEFRSWLSGSNVEGAADAVRLRIDADAEAYGVSQTQAALRWASLFAEHATPEGMIWIREVLGDGGAYWSAWSAFTEAARPETIELAREILRKPFDPFVSNPGPFASSTHYWGALVALVRSDPDDGLAGLEEEMDRYYTEAKVRAPLNGVVRLYMEAIPLERVGPGSARVRDLLETGWSRRGQPNVRVAQTADAILKKRGTPSRSSRGSWLGLPRHSWRSRDGAVPPQPRAKCGRVL